MRLGLTILALAYILSQFFRAFLGVITGPLEAEIGVGADDLATASGLWFISFAAMQIPVGWALDTVGPRRTSAGLLLIGGGGGALVFALAGSAVHINLAMILIGIGCAPVLMASYYIFAREFSPVQFATLAATMIGVGTLGNLLASYPLTFAVETIGWRAALGALALVCALVAVGIQITVKDPATVEGGARGSLMDVLRIKAIWLIAPMAIVGYAPAAAIRGLWIGPYLRDVHGFSDGQIGSAALVMGIAMIGGVFLYGPLDRIFGTRKWVVFCGNGLTLLCVLGLIWLGAGSATLAVALMCGVGFFGATFPVIIAHGKGFLPAHLTGRGVTLLNLFSIGGVGVAQFASRPVFLAGQQMGAGALAPFVLVYGFFAVILAAGLLIYLFARDTTA